ncbi:transporter [Faecalicatena contorta]|uniref:transporter n=1 Tax=Faecalicatena contorta TaxID=39482 RepID=UPI001F3CC0CA|nr:transporter [Faecalicatena contorta]
MKQSLQKASVLFVFFLMLLFPSQVFDGACRGLLLWFHTVLPTLLPFLILSSLLIQTKAIDWIVHICAPLFCRFFRITPYGSYAILTGFLCGYPMGGKTTCDLLRTGYISYTEAKYLLSFCNNASPIFIISYVVLQNLTNRRLIAPALLILMMAPVLSSFLFRRFYSSESDFVPLGNNKCISAANNHAGTYGSLMDDCIMNGFENITKVGGYIILFSIFLSLAQLLPVRTFVYDYFLLPSLEITNGIAWICRRGLSDKATFFLCMTCTSFGGLCAVAQTRCMLAGSTLSIRPYIIEKLVTAAVTSLLTFIYLLFFY